MKKIIIILSFLLLLFSCNSNELQSIEKIEDVKKENTEILEKTDKKVISKNKIKADSLEKRSLVSVDKRTIGKKILNNECEKSGGKIIFSSCNTIGCASESQCSCLLDNSFITENELSKNKSTFLLKKGEICTKCIKDSDCGENYCKDINGGCDQKTATCENGVCHNTHIFEYYSNMYKCIDNNCKIKDNHTAYIKDLSSYRGNYIEGEDVKGLLRIKNITNKKQNYKFFMNLISISSGKTILTKSGSITIEPNLEKIFQIPISTDKIDIGKNGKTFELSVEIPKVGNFTMHRSFEITQKEYVIIKSIDVTKKIPKSYAKLSDHLQMINIKMNVENPTNKTFRVYARFHVYTDIVHGHSEVRKGLQRFIDFKPFETKELTEQFAINKLSPGFYDVQAEVDIDNFSVASDYKGFEITE